MIRAGEVPDVAVTIVGSSPSGGRRRTIGGVGELGVPTPALANAYFRLTGRRIRALPFFPGATMGRL